MSPHPASSPGRSSRRCRAASVSAAAGAVLGLLWVAAAAPAADADLPDPQDAPASRPAASPDEAELEDIDLLTLEVPMVVTAARHQQPITAVPYAVSVITAEDIRRAGADTVADALRLVPGIDVAGLGAGVPAVSPRGFHGFFNSRALVLVDGRTLSDALVGGMGITWPFRLEDIERIEVIRGPAGVSWGSAAVNGVINVITKDPADQLGLTLRGQGGSRGSHREYAGYAFAADRLRLRVSGEHHRTEGFSEGGSWLRRLEDEYQAGQAAVHAVYEPAADSRLTLSGGSSLVGPWAAPPPIALFGQTRSGGQANFLMARWDRSLASDNVLQVIGYVNDTQLTAALPSIDYRFQQLALQVSHTFAPAEEHTFTWGLDGRADLVDAGNADPFLLTDDHVNSGIIGLYAQDQWRLAPKWTLNLGVRADYDTYGGLQPSGRASLAYDLTDHSSVWAAVSRAFQMPPGAARHVDIPLATELVRARCDPEIGATQLVAWEIGHRGRYSDRLNTAVSLYWHEYDDLTAFKPMPGPPGLLRLDLDNRAAASTYGVELEADYRVTDALTLLGNYTFERLDWRSPVGFVSGTDLITPPKHKFMLAARYDLTADLHLSAHLYYVDAVRAPDPANPIVPRRIDPYFRLDLRAEYELWEDRVSIAAGVRNLLDRDHPEGGSMFLNSAEVPRMVYAEIRMRLQ